MKNGRAVGNEDWGRRMTGQTHGWMYLKFHTILPDTYPAVFCGEFYYDAWGNRGNPPPPRATLSLDHNRGLGWTIFGHISNSISHRLKCAKIEASVAEIRIRKRVAQIGGWMAAIFSEIAGNRGSAIAN